MPLTPRLPFAQALERQWKHQASRELEKQPKVHRRKLCREGIFHIFNVFFVCCFLYSRNYVRHATTHPGPTVSRVYVRVRCAVKPGCHLPN